MHVHLNWWFLIGWKSEKYEHIHVEWTKTPILTLIDWFICLSICVASDSFLWCIPIHFNHVFFVSFYRRHYFQNGVSKSSFQFKIKKNSRFVVQSSKWFDLQLIHFWLRIRIIVIHSFYATSFSNLLNAN